MKLRIFFLWILCLLVFTTGFSQEDEEWPPLENVPIAVWPYAETLKIIDSLDKANPVEYWSRKHKFGVDFNEVTFTNWSAGGSNSVTVLLSSEIKRTYSRRNIRWQNEFISQYGINVQEGQKMRKNADNFELNSTFGYRTDTLSSWYHSAKLNLKSQFDSGYNYPDRTKSVSNFMAPGYMFLGVGAEHGRESDVFTLYLSPATIKTIFVMNQRLANEGAFGVEKAIYDDDGNILRKGKRNKTEFGILITNEYKVEVWKNINMVNRISLYTDYLNHFGNIDIDWRLELDFKINSFVAAKIGSHLLYDDDTKTKRINSEGIEEQRGAKVQWKQQLGIGLVISL